MISKKELLKQINELKESNEWVTEKMIKFKSSLDAAKTQQNLLTGEDVNEDKTMQEEILQNRIPAKIQWLYWIHINEYCHYWMGRWSNFEHPAKPLIMDCLRTCVMFGQSGINKECTKSYYVGNYDAKKGAYACVPLVDLTNLGKDAFLVDSNNNYVLNPVLKTEWVSAEELVVFRFQANGLGIFMWYLIPVCLQILTHIMIPMNASLLINKIFVRVADTKTYKTMYKDILDPTKLTVKIMDNDVAGELNKTNELLKTQPSSTANTEQLILANKYIIEYLCNLYGIPVTSSKQQSLSSDANLSVSTGEMKAKVHDDRIKVAMEKLGIKLEIEEIDMTPENQNADKEGEGQANTDGDTLEKEDK